MKDVRQQIEDFLESTRDDHLSKVAHAQLSEIRDTLEKNIYDWMTNVTPDDNATAGWWWSKEFVEGIAESCRLLELELQLLRSTITERTMIVKSVETAKRVSKAIEALEDPLYALRVRYNVLGESDLEKIKSTMSEPIEEHGEDFEFQPTINNDLPRK